ncbi:hypothetical protein [Candidatus Albibeggiatoa sp. nov. NOAA]|uniref:hypothetical protein n=1 Tax=Candidatus Albibeggiatoa sp. nov. NOAA TaxID=3162724 RepID=UPI0032FAB846|nr:hypothetical protein [Thiotrichaceae bacterium]
MSKDNYNLTIKNNTEFAKRCGIYFYVKAMEWNGNDKKEFTTKPTITYPLWLVVDMPAKSATQVNMPASLKLFYAEKKRLRINQYDEKVIEVTKTNPDVSLDLSKTPAFQTVSLQRAKPAGHVIRVTTNTDLKDSQCIGAEIAGVPIVNVVSSGTQSVILSGDFFSTEGDFVTEVLVTLLEVDPKKCPDDLNPKQINLLSKDSHTLKLTAETDDSGDGNDYMNATLNCDHDKGFYWVNSTQSPDDIDNLYTCPVKK